MSPMFDLQPQMRGMVDGLNASVLGCEDQMETAVLTFFANGHISGYGEPGTGKTRMALAIAAAISSSSSSWILAL